MFQKIFAFLYVLFYQDCSQDLVCVYTVINISHISGLKFQKRLELYFYPLLYVSYFPDSMFDNCYKIIDVLMSILTVESSESLESFQ